VQRLLVVVAYQFIGNPLFCMCDTMTMIFYMPHIIQESFTECVMFILFCFRELEDTELSKRDLEDEKRELGDMLQKQSQQLTVSSRLSFSTYLKGHMQFLSSDDQYGCELPVMNDK
jgi:hypothetical protein